jgi:hypothetical protein
MVAARARDTAAAPYVPFDMCPVRWVVGGALADRLRDLPASSAKGLGSTADVKTQ